MATIAANVILTAVAARHLSADAARRPKSVLVATAKGLFTLSADPASTAAPATSLQGWEVSTLFVSPTTPTHLLAGTVHWSYGATVRESRDAGVTWTQLDGRPAYPDGSPYKLNRIWQIVAAHPSQPGTLYAGVDEAGLFKSTDNGQTWIEVSALTNDAQRKNWFAGGGGLCLHTIIPDYSNPNRIWLGISAVGCFRTTDGGQTWTRQNIGLPHVAATPPEPCPAYCVHRIVQHPTKPDTLFMQFHGGVYVSRDGAETWQKIEHGLPGNFGFPMVITASGNLFIAPLHSDEQRVFKDGHFAIYRSTDEGATWHPTAKGLPTEPTYTGVLRDSMCVGGEKSIFFGTTNGQVFASHDDGDTWHRLPGSLPRILSIRAV